MRHIFFCLVAMCAVVLASLPITNHLQFTNNTHAAPLVDFTISGNVKADGANLQGASVSLTGTQSQTTTTDANGNYSFTVASGGNYTVSVYKSGYSFNPTTQTFNNLQSNQTANFQNGVPLPAPRPLGLVAWYKGEGNAADSGGNGYNGTLVGGTTFAAGKVGQAFNLDGVDDHVEVASNIVIDPTNAGALAAWVRFNQLPSDAGRNMAVINKSDLMSSFDLTAETDNRFRFNVGLGNSVNSTTVVQTGVWYFVVGAWDSAGLRIYVNGVLENTNSTQNVVRSPNGQALKIGEGGPLAGQFFHGLIDEAQVYNRALISTEVQTIYTAGSAGISMISAFTAFASNGKIAFHSDQASPGVADIFTMNSDGTNQTNITNLPTAQDAAASWSPDGSKIVFQSRSNIGPSQIYTMNANGSNQTQLTFTAQNDGAPSWSPDGSKIVFLSQRDHNLNEVYVMNADGSNQTRLTNNTATDFDPKWSPDGSKIVFSSTRDDFTNVLHDIYVMNADGTNQTRLTNNSVSDIHPAWSPDGATIIFATNRVGGIWEIFEMNADGSNQMNISNTPALEEIRPFWAPNGTKIVFETSRDGNPEIYTMNPDGSQQTRLTNNTASDRHPSWQPVRGSVIVRVLTNVNLTFATVTQTGYTVATPLLQSQIPALPPNYTLNLPLQAYDIRTSAQYSGNTTVSFDVPNVADAAACSRLRVLHFENGAWTAANNSTPVYNSSTRVCTVSQTAASLGLFVVAQCVPRVLYDFDGDRRADLSIFRPSNGQWWLNFSSDGVARVYTFGTNTDRIVPADYDGDGKTDVAFWRPSTGEWFVLRSSNLTFYSAPFGAAGDLPAPGDFDADGRADFTVFRPSNGTWYINQTSDGIRFVPFGTSGDVPVVGDYDGDCKADVAIFRPSNGSWWMSRSTAGFFATVFGSSQDKPVQADYTGDGKTDIAFWSPSNGYWYVLRSEDYSYYAAPFGTSGDIPVPGDYDADARSDFAVFRPSGGTWFIQRSSQGTLIQPFGVGSDIPVPSAYIP